MRPLSLIPSFLPFSRDYYALVVAEQKCFQKGKHTTRSVVAGVVTRIDLLNFIAKVSSTSVCPPLLSEAAVRISNTELLPRPSRSLTLHPSLSHLRLYQGPPAAEVAEHRASSLVSAAALTAVHQGASFTSTLPCSVGLFQNTHALAAPGTVGVSE